MTSRAYVLITTEVGKTEDVAQELEKLPGVTMADIVSGTYDIVAVVEGLDQYDIGRLVLNQIHTVPGLKNTLTLMAMSRR